MSYGAKDLGHFSPMWGEEERSGSHWISMKTCHIWDEPNLLCGYRSASQRQKDMHNCIQRILPSPNHQESYKFYENLMFS